MTELLLHQGAFSIDLGSPRLDLTLRNIVVDGEWVSGDVEVKASAFGKSLDKTVPFKTLNHGEQQIDIGVASLDLKVELPSPHRVCASGNLAWGPVHVSVGSACTDF